MQNEEDPDQVVEVAKRAVVAEATSAKLVVDTFQKPIERYRRESHEFWAEMQVVMK